MIKYGKSICMRIIIDYDTLQDRCPVTMEIVK